MYSAIPLTAKELITVHLSHHDLKRLELYARNMVDHHMIGDILPTLARLLFLGRLRGMRLSYLQVAILLATGLQHRDVDAIAVELELPVNQVLAFFNKVRADSIHTCISTHTDKCNYTCTYIFFITSAAVLFHCGHTYYIKSLWGKKIDMEVGFKNLTFTNLLLLSPS